MANIRDLAVGSVLTAPSPATSGTTLVLQSGQGADMPTDLPFKLLVFPTGAVPSKSNSEKVLVTARSTDTLTIVRAQGETTAKNIAAGWLVANAVFTEDIFNSSSVTGEVPVGTINGTNTAFTLASAPTTGSVRVFLNGVRLKLTDDYTISNSTITFVTAPPTGSNVLVDYSVGTQANSVGTNSYIAKEAVTGTIDGTNAVFTTARAYIGGSLQVFVNGLMQSGTMVTETSPSAGTFTLDVAPATGDIIHVAYQFNLNPSSNADTVDGIHASVTATANQLLPLTANARFTGPSLFRVALNATESSNVVDAGAVAANTWTDLKGNQSFTVSSPNSVVIIYLAIGMQVGSGSNMAVGGRVVIDSAGTPITRNVGATAVVAGSYGNPFSGSAPLVLTGLVAGTHTIKTQVLCTSAGNQYCRPATTTYEGYSTTIMEIGG